MPEFIIYRHDRGRPDPEAAFPAGGQQAAPRVCQRRALRGGAVTFQDFYTEVYVPRHVNRNDVNPRPLSPLVPSHGLMGCFSADEKTILAVAWEPYQELFQGVITCIHSDFRIGGLKPGETKHIRGKLYIVPADIPALLRRSERDFPEHTTR